MNTMDQFNMVKKMELGLIYGVKKPNMKENGKII